MLWVDKYRPTDLTKLDVHTDLSNQLARVVSNGDFPHLLLHGPPGAGKKTRVMALLRYFFGMGVERLKVEHKSVKANASNTVEVTSLSSPHHVEINPCEVGIYDRVVVMQLIKEIAESAPLPTSKMEQKNGPGFKVIVLNEVDELTKGAQQALRRTMEKHMRTCRLVLLASSTSRIIEPLRSRCLAIRVPLPSPDEVTAVLRGIGKAEGFDVPRSLCASISEQSGRNLRRAIFMLEATKCKNLTLTEETQAVMYDWERCIFHLAQDICTEQSPQKLSAVRDQFDELLANCIAPEIILQTLTKYLMENVDSTMKCEISKWAAHYDHRLRQGSTPIMHLEAFAAKFMYLYKSMVGQIR